MGLESGFDIGLLSEGAARVRKRRVDLNCIVIATSVLFCKFSYLISDFTFLDDVQVSMEESSSLYTPYSPPIP